ncbi:MAG: hypothetical protein U1A06_06140 [Hoeflea sp.]|nr:hypothetical protein [Hoeflea sp.]
MGASSRAAYAIEPANGDLLTPGRTARPRVSRPRDVEDACFETIGGPRDSFSRKPEAAQTGSVFKSRLEGSPGHGPFPCDYAKPEGPFPQTGDRAGRLDIFGADGAGLASGGSRLVMAACAVVLVASGLAAAALWSASAPAPAPQVDARARAPIFAPPAAKALPMPVEAPLSADSVTTSSIPAATTGTGKGGYTTPSPRPARIEKAGSILMIRPGGS